MSTEPDWIRDALSSARFAPYLSKAGGDLEAAVDWCWWNIGISAAFYTPLHCLEVALRNAMHRQLTATFGRTDWWKVAPLDKGGLRRVEETYSKLSGPARPLKDDDVVAQLSFGFWVSLVNGTYHRRLWIPCLHRAFPHYKGSQKSLRANLHPILELRNRIMHYEPIHHRHLKADHEKILGLVGYLSPSMVKQLTLYDQVEAVLLQRPECPSSGSRGDA
jgi:hypothetical protein